MIMYLEMSLVPGVLKHLLVFQLDADLDILIQPMEGCLVLTQISWEAIARKYLHIFIYTVIT